MIDRYYKCLNSNNYFGCEAIQYSDQMVCKRCDLVWDINDLEPPECLTGKQLFDKEKAKLFKDLK